MAALTIEVDRILSGLAWNMMTGQMLKDVRVRELSKAIKTQCPELTDNEIENVAVEYASLFDAEEAIAMEEYK